MGMTLRYYKISLKYISDKVYFVYKSLKPVIKRLLAGTRIPRLELPRIALFRCIALFGNSSPEAENIISLQSLSTK